MAKSLEGRVAIVTGAGGGIGRHHALALAQHGARVVVNDIGANVAGRGGSGNMADAVVEEIKAAGGEAVANYDSVATREGADRIVYTALDAFGELDVVVNNAGILRDRTLVNMTEDEFDSVYEVHLRGTYLVTQTAVRYLRTHRRPGRIINTTDVAGMLGNFGQSNYAAMKAGVVGFTKAVSLELAPIGATCNAVAPMALTRMTRDLPIFRGASEETMGPQHISPVVVFLASALSAQINGRVIGVQGGKIFEYQVRISEGAVKDAGMWTPQEIADRWGDITK